jgi:hypothetical protein
VAFPQGGPCVPQSVPSLGFEAAIWQATTRSYSNDPSVLRIARSSIAQTPRRTRLLAREVVRFFCAHPITVEEMDIFAITLRMPPAQSGVCPQGPHARFAGSADARVAPRPRSDRAYRGRTSPRGGSARPCAWTSVGTRGGQQRQLAGCCDRGLVAEPSDRGSLQARGVSGNPAAHSRRSRGRDAGRAPLCRELRGKVHCRVRVDLVATPPSRRQYRPLLTIELDRQHRAVQVRGFANRAPCTDERKLLERWAVARGIDLPK